MAQHDYDIANQSGANFRADLNNALDAIVSNNSGSSEPSTTFAYEWWIDTSANVLKLRNSANNAWITLPLSITADNSTSGALTVNGNLSTTGTLDVNGGELILDADADTSITADTDDQIDIKIAGADVYTITASSFDFNGKELILDADADTSITADTDDQIDFKIGATDVMTLTNSHLVLKGTTPKITIGDGGAEDTALIFDGNAQDFYLGLDDTDDVLKIGTGTTVGTGPLVVITSSGDVGISDTSPSARLEVAGSSNSTYLIAGGDDATNLRALKFTSSASASFNGAVHTIDAPSVQGTLAFAINTTERARFNSSGDFIVSGTGVSQAGSVSLIGSGHISSVLTSGQAGDSLFCAISGVSNGFQIQHGAAFTNSQAYRFFVGSSVALEVNTAGNVVVGGSLSKGSGSFRIDHPLESKKETHHLVHSFVEAPQADNIYRGTVSLENGSATINLDSASGMTEGTFVLLNTNIQCFTTNETDWDAVKGNVTDNILTLSCENTSSSATVSWLVIGERHDQHMIDADWTDENGKVIVEKLKEIED